jgi:2-polyprenyl-6-methoxyphenol hydroxylase-like FAD-dependent oxidoreductase
MDMAVQTITTQCCVTGGGPAGMMLGFLLARAGVDVVVLEKHGDFFRDFRGDTIHPSTLELMHELGLLDEFLKLPHYKVQHVGGQIGDTQVTLADMSGLPTTCKFIAFMPQWDFLNFLADHGKRYRGFHLMMNTQATDLVYEGERVAGVRATREGAELEIHADLVVAADGRHSTLRERAGFAVENLGAPMDVLWMRISRKSGDASEAFGHIEAGRFFIMLDRGDYWQCAYVIPKGSAEALIKEPIEEFRREILKLSAWLTDRVNELKSWDDVKLLTVAVDRLKQWYRRGLLCIGDAAHAMSPVGGVGVNIAVQDAVAAANILYKPLLDHAVTTDDLRKVQARREWPVRVTQRIQIFIQNRVVSAVLAGTERPKPPFVVKLTQWFPILQRIPARVIGIGVQPEHIHTPQAA